jgi:hypothetical protein
MPEAAKLRFSKGNGGSVDDTAIDSCSLKLIGLYHPLDGVANSKYKLLHFLAIVIFYKDMKALALNGIGAAI